MNQPAHIEMKGGKDTRQRIWEAIRNARQDFTARQLAHVTKKKLSGVRAYLEALQAGGYLQLAYLDIATAEKHFSLIKDNGLEAPRLNKQGQPIVRGRVQEQIWRTLHIVRGDFNSHELAAMASTEAIPVLPAAVQSYLKHLVHAGYVAPTQRGQGRGRVSRAGRYRFILTRYSGPRAPIVQSTKSVYDPNLARIVWQEESRHD